jgi:hypothetical protein
MESRVRSEFRRHRFESRPERLQQLLTRAHTVLLVADPDVEEEDEDES